MEQVKINKILFKLHRFSCWGIAVLIVLYLVSGYGMTKNIIDPAVSKILHEKVLAPPLFLLFVLHVSINLRNLFLRKWAGGNEKWVNIYTFILALIVLGVLFYLYLI